MNDKVFENNDNLSNQENTIIYEDKLFFNNNIFNCIIKNEMLKNINFLLFSNDVKYEKNLNRENENQNSILYFDLIINNVNNLNIIIDNIIKDEITLRINIIEDKKISSSLYIYMKSVDKKTKVGREKILDYNIKEIIEKCKNKEKYADFFRDYPCRNLIKCYCFSLNNNKKYIVFNSDVSVSITIKNLKITFTIRTNYELKNKLVHHNINIKNTYINEFKLIDVIDSSISSYVKNNELILKYVKNAQVYKIKFNQNTLNLDKNYYPNELSEYFNDYFNIDNINEKFIYEKTDERKQVYENFERLITDINIKKYLITGPFSCGKSLTLFMISREMDNIIYINLKILKANLEDKEKCLKIILSEFSRLNIEENKFNERFENFNFNQNILGQLLDALEIILDLSNNSIVLILDQYKSSNVNSYKDFSNRIDNFIKNKNLKLVQCSSINDNEIRDLLMPTWIKYFSNPSLLIFETQDFYFYYHKLYEPKCKTFSQILFRNKSKYIKIITRKNTLENSLDEISTDIINKIKSFKKYEEEKNNLIYSDIEFDDILIFLHKNMKKEFDKKNLLRYVSLVPLKFFIIDFKKDTFEILPLFPFLEYCFIKYIETNNCDEYFKKERYKNLSFLTNSVKGEYFEFAAKKALIDKNIIKIENIENFESRKVYEISNMDSLIENPYQDIINKLNEELYNKKTPIIEEIIEVNSNEKNKNNYIYIDVKAHEKIDEEKIENQMKKKYMEHYSLNKFSNELNKYKNVLNKTEFFCLKSLDDYKYDEIKIRINKKMENTIKKLENQKKDKVFKIRISELTKKYKKMFTGNENIFIDQENQHGKIVDFACLFGAKEQKIFVGFQMKCYSNNSKLENKFLSKPDVKENLQKILLNCKDLFKCDIKKWYYYLIFYYNKEDETHNQISFYNQYQCLNQNIEFLFYDPKEKKFFSSDFKAIKNLPVTNDADLDYFTYLNKKSNYQILELKYDLNVDNVNIISYKKEYLKGILQFEIDLNKYGTTAKEIIKNISDLTKVTNLFYCKSNFLNEIEFPSINKLYLYSKKNKKEYISVKRTKNGIDVRDLEKEKSIDNYDQKSLAQLIDLKKRVYILTIIESIRKKNSIDYLREIIAEKFEEKQKEKDMEQIREKILKDLDIH